MIAVNARATFGPHEPFTAFDLERRDVGPTDVLIDIAFAGICHSDIHHAHNDWGGTRYPLVPGHEIAGTVAAVGSDVTRFAVGDRVGVGCMVDSCRECDNCRAGFEQFCRQGDVKTANGTDRQGKPTQGGYSERIVVDERFVVRVPDGIPLENAAPLMCAGITLFSPLRQWGVGPGTRVGIVGFGGLGHIGVQLASAMGAHTTALDLSLDKREDGLRLGAAEYFATSDDTVFTSLADSFDVIISTVPVNLDMGKYLGLLDTGGVLVLIGAPERPLEIGAFSLLRNRRSIAGTLIGGMPETQEMLDFCGEHGIRAEVEIVDADEIDEAYRRVIAGDVRYRFVIDVSTMAAAA
ncbi:NAD(P)-dependent alcohol dehydrogenase [Microbacterium sp. X-17]|uniref:NAD(P)-dependent alcohol dehydrogenase n=1 Tax=Microbacterium sp. X-17 TaxID=3144404 RepID=UPI0031F53DC6